MGKKKLKNYVEAWLLTILNCFNYWMPNKNDSKQPFTFWDVRSMWSVCLPA